ncbi:SGF29 tudor-like domain-containing protein [Fomitopsis serialis]|uniref:SGF29 tudor-like domain-containing protein n=1 Tax=Fomitopsis serialis TaxID=139415 RepID=UPI002008531E|nr:SGF29 tudor-like domain-containing protein [Neoantrodia serialis]KAH9936286.1 SGF29 tudor-like domain-containing protein [Neoantrodia serialis]
MASRRGSSKRPASSEEIDFWSHAAASLSTLSSTMYNEPATGDPIGRVNRLLLAWPTDDNLPAEGYESVRSTYKKLTAGLNEIKTAAERDVEAIDKAIEQLDVLIALRKAPEIVPQEKRNKRPRAHSPAGAPAPAVPVSTPAVRSVTLNLPARSSVGPQTSVPFSREPKARREALAKQLPLQEGRKVAFHPPQNSKGAETVAGGKDEEWILAVVIGCINQDKNRYEVQDPEPQEDGQPGQRYNTTLRAIIPLPDPNAPPDNAAHLNAYPEFSLGSIVMALYPDTSCFYRAEVVASPRDMQPSGRNGASSTTPTYKLKFEDDDDQEHLVSAQWVVEWPGGS